VGVGAAENLGAGAALGEVHPAHTIADVAGVGECVTGIRIERKSGEGVVATGSGGEAGGEIIATGEAADSQEARGGAEAVGGVTRDAVGRIEGAVPDRVRLPQDQDAPQNFSGAGEGIALGGGTIRQGAAQGEGAGSVLHQGDGTGDLSARYGAVLAGAAGRILGGTTEGEIRGVVDRKRGGGGRIDPMVPIVRHQAPVAQTGKSLVVSVQVKLRSPARAGSCDGVEAQHRGGRKGVGDPGPDVDSVLDVPRLDRGVAGVGGGGTQDDDGIRVVAITCVIAEDDTSTGEAPNRAVDVEGD
jgi:hypothetical protein